MKMTTHMLLALVLHTALLSLCIAQETNDGAVLAEPGDRYLADNSAELRFRGVIRPYRRVILRSPVDSRVLQIDTAVGQEVAAETVLIRLDTEALEQDVRLAQSQLEKVRAELKACGLGLEQIDRSSDQLREGREEAEQRLAFVRRPQPPPGYPGRVVNRRSDVMRSPMREKAADEVQQAINGVDANQVRLRAKRSRLLSLREELQRAEHAAVAATHITRQRLDEASVTANVTGVIARCFVQPSERVNAGDKLVEVIQTDRLRATLWLPDKVAVNFDYHDLPRDARIRASNTQASWQKGIVRNMPPLPHPRADQAMLEVEIDNMEGGLRAGMWVDAILETSDVAQAARQRSLQ